MLNKSLKVVTSIALMLLVSSAFAKKDAPWITDMEQAKKIAKAEGKSIFMFFTGSDWCGWCIKLDEEVLSHDEFLDYAKEKLVLVELDFPQDESLVTEEQRDHNEKWKDVFQPRGYPTVYLTDASAQAYAQTGYQAGGPQAYIEHLESFVAQKTAVEELTEKALQASGMEKVTLLDELLTKGGKLVSGKSDLMAEILALTKGKDEAMYNKYRMLKGGQDLVDGADALMNSDKSADQKLKGMLELFAANSFVKEGEALEGFLQNNLASAFPMAGKADQGVEFFGEKASDESYDLPMRQMFTVMQGFMYAETGDEEKAVELVDEAIDMDPDTLEEHLDSLYGQIRKILQRRKLQVAP
ncbi:thioredoxin family protein [Porticoccaceae bacterium LTM1]|nr:thioredoxin family protein [Porticoccaceae bacterium LTM1]